MLILSIVETQVLGFGQVKDAYAECPDFGKIVEALANGSTFEYPDFVLSDGYLFCRRILCVPSTSLRDFFILEAHAGGCSGHFGHNKTIAAVEQQFYCPSLKRDLVHTVAKCRTCSRAKMTKQNAGLYTPLLV